MDIISWQVHQGKWFQNTIIRVGEFMFLSHSCWCYEPTTWRKIINVTAGCWRRLTVFIGFGRWKLVNSSYLGNGEWWQWKTKGWRLPFHPYFWWLQSHFSKCRQSSGKGKQLWSRCVYWGNESAFFTHHVCSPAESSISQGYVAM